MACRLFNYANRQRERRGLLLPFALLLLIVLLTAAFFWLPNPGLLSSLLMLLGAVPFMGVLLAHPLFTALLLGRVRRGARALSQQAPTHRKLGFVAVAGMVLLLFGGLLYNVAILLGGGIAQMILFLPATCMAIIVAMRPNARLFRSPVRMATWRPTWGKRFFFALLTLVILTIPLTSLLASGIRQLFILLSPWLWGANGNPMNTLLFYGIPLVSTIAIVRAIRRAKLSDNVLRFTTIPSLLVVGGMLLIIGGMLLWAGTVLLFLPSVFPQILALLTLPYNSWLLQFIGMLIALVVILRALFSRSHAHAEARPKDASSADVIAARSRGYYPVDGTKEEKPQEEL